MGGSVYKVSYSFLFETHHNSHIAQIASEQLQSSPDDDVVLEWDEYQLKFVLEYLQGKGHVILPRTVPKAVYLAHLFYYGITNVDESKIVQISTLASLRYRQLWNDEVTAKIKSWNIRIAIGLLAKVCVVNHLTSGEKLVIAIQHDDVVLELDGDRLKFVLEYLRGKGHVILPRTVPKALYSAYLFYYGIINVDESKIVRISTVAGLHHRRQWEGVVRAEIKSWNIRIAIGLLAKVCAINHVDSGEKLVFTIQHDDITRLSLLDDSPTCSLKLWMELRALLLLKGKKSF